MPRSRARTRTIAAVGLAVVVAAVVLPMSLASANRRAADENDVNSKVGGNETCTVSTDDPGEGGGQCTTRVTRTRSGVTRTVVTTTVTRARTQTQTRTTTTTYPPGTTDGPAPTETKVVIVGSNTADEGGAGGSLPAGAVIAFLAVSGLGYLFINRRRTLRLDALYE